MVAFLRADNSTGKTTAGSIKTNIRNFRGWHCAVGYTLLSINSRGEVWGSVCKQGGSLGNIYTGALKWPTQFTICDRAACHCSSDLKIPKGRSLEAIKTLINIPDSTIQPSNDLTDIVSIRRHSKGNSRIFSIDWSIGTRCNYDCSYCSPRQHNNRSPHLPLQQFCAAWDVITDRIKQPILLTMLGGEPTINPEYLDMLAYASSPTTTIVTTTNGTAHVSKLIAALSYGGMTISIHQEYCNIPKMIEKIAILAKHINTGFLNISFMMPPNTSQQFLAFKDALPVVKGLNIEAVPIFNGSTFELLHYEPHELEIIATN